MSQFHLQIITPDGVQFDGQTQQLSVRGTEGELAILAGHLPLVTALAEGECRVYTDDGVRAEVRCPAAVFPRIKDFVIGGSV